MSDYSVHSIHQSDRPKWLPGEDYAAVAFIAMVVLLVAEINIQIHRVFKRRIGLYFWAMQLGSGACAVDAVGMVMKNLIPSAHRVWILYTIMVTTGWATYTVAQLVVLYSRLHLVIDSPRTQKFVLYVIVVVSPMIIIADWVVVWPAYNPATTRDWSVPTAIVERIAQIGFSAVEVMINIIYGVSIVRLLKHKATVRQRRVMVDLMYVNIIAAAFDILNIILVYVNRVGVSHPIQVFGYALKLRIEFVILNQLMAVAARGFRRGTFEEGRYHRRESVGNNWDWNANDFRKETPPENSTNDDGDSRCHLCADRRKLQQRKHSIPPPIFLTPFCTPDDRQRENLSPVSPITNDVASRNPSPTTTIFERLQYNGPKLQKKQRMKSAVQKARERVSILTLSARDQHEDEICPDDWERHGSRTLEVPWLASVSDLSEEMEDGLWGCRGERVSRQSWFHA